jgi:hypothetical protein
MVHDTTFESVQGVPLLEAGFGQVGLGLEHVDLQRVCGVFGTEAGWRMGLSVGRTRSIGIGGFASSPRYTVEDSADVWRSGVGWRNDGAESHGAGWNQFDVVVEEVYERNIPELPVEIFESGIKSRIAVSQIL